MVSTVSSYTLTGLTIQTGDILCLAFDKDQSAGPGDYWRLLGLLIPGEVDHVAIYLGPQGHCIESAARGVILFDLAGKDWQPKKMYRQRGRFKDSLVGVAYPLHGRGYTQEQEASIRLSVATYCLAQAAKPYNINFLNPQREDAFYCSQLAYKAYLPHGIDLNTGLGIPNLPGTDKIIFPQEIWRGCHHQEVAASP